MKKVRYQNPHNCVKSLRRTEWKGGEEGGGEVVLCDREGITVLPLREKKSSEATAANNLMFDLHHTRTETTCCSCSPFSREPYLPGWGSTHWQLQHSGTSPFKAQPGPSSDPAWATQQVVTNQPELHSKKGKTEARGGSTFPFPILVSPLQSR